MALPELAWSPLANNQERESHKARRPPDAQRGDTHPMLLDGYVGKVDKHVVELTGARGVLHRAEAAKPKLVPGRGGTLSHGRWKSKFTSCRAAGAHL